jgi:hypothetical protein
MSKNPYQVRVNVKQVVEDTSEDVEVGTTREIDLWRTVGKQASLNEARKVAEGHGYNRPREDVRIERVNGRLIECVGKLE